MQPGASQANAFTNHLTGNHSIEWESGRMQAGAVAAAAKAIGAGTNPRSRIVIDPDPKGSMHRRHSITRGGI